MKEGFPYFILLAKPDHYYVGICSTTGQDFVPYLKEEVAVWLDESMKEYEDYVYESSMNPYRVEPDTEEVGIAFADETDAAAFKLRWL